jgi:hypothetical protein
MGMIYAMFVCAAMGNGQAYCEMMGDIEFQSAQDCLRAVANLYRSNPSGGEYRDGRIVMDGGRSWIECEGKASWGAVQ